MITFKQFISEELDEIDELILDAEKRVARIIGISPMDVRSFVHRQPVNGVQYFRMWIDLPEEDQEFNKTLYQKVVAKVLHDVFGKGVSLTQVKTIRTAHRAGSKMVLSIDIEIHESTQ